MFRRATEADERKREDKHRESLKDICPPHDAFADDVADPPLPGKETGPHAKQHSGGERDERRDERDRQIDAGCGEHAR
jgi:hypothetical protein